MTTSLCLASRSPRRRALLDRLGLRYRLLDVVVNERVPPGCAPADYVCDLALAKAQAGWATQSEEDALPVLGADTAVVVDERILGKPAHEDDAVAMLETLSGRWHEVFTGVAVVRGDEAAVDLTVTQVEFAPISTALARAYWRTGEPADKAGAYAIQGLGAAFVVQIHGSYTGVVGLPLHETLTLLTRFGVEGPAWEEMGSGER